MPQIIPQSGTARVHSKASWLQRIPSLWDTAFLGTFLEETLLGQMCYICVIWIDVAKLPSIRLVLTNNSISRIWEKVCVAPYHTFIKLGFCQFGHCRVAFGLCMSMGWVGGWVSIFSYVLQEHLYFLFCKFLVHSLSHLSVGISVSLLPILFFLSTLYITETCSFFFFFPFQILSCKNKFPLVTYLLTWP